MERPAESFRDTRAGRARLHKVPCRDAIAAASVSAVRARSVSWRHFIHISIGVADRVVVATGAVGSVRRNQNSGLVVRRALVHWHKRFPELFYVRISAVGHLFRHTIYDRHVQLL